MKCFQCGTCCKLFLINLTEKEYRSKKYTMMFDEFVEDAEESEILGTHEMGFEEAELCGVNIVAQKEDGSCIYLKDGKCSIHERRPKSCKGFFCDSKEERFKGMKEEINLHKNQSKEI